MSDAITLLILLRKLNSGILSKSTRYLWGHGYSSYSCSVELYLVTNYPSKVIIPRGLPGYCRLPTKALLKR